MAWCGEVAQSRCGDGAEGGEVEVKAKPDFRAVNAEKTGEPKIAA